MLDVSSDSMKLAETFQRFAKDVLGQYGEDVDEVEFDKDERVVVYNYNSKTNIKPVYNKNGIISYCKEEVTRKNDKVTMTSHSYINISLKPLIDIGYFNLDNLIANNNFSIGDEGITWTFGIYDIACYSVGETVITLDYETLKPYILDNSEIAELMN